MKVLFRIISLFFVLCSLSLPTLTQTRTGGEKYAPVSDEISLEQAINYSLENNFDLDPAIASVNAAKARKVAAFGQYLPRVDVGGSYQRLLSNSDVQRTENGAVVVGPNTYSLYAQGRYTIFDGFSREAEYEISDSDFDGSMYRFKQLEQDIAIEVTRRYINALQLRQAYLVRKENTELGELNVKRAKAQYEAGIIPVNDVLTQEADLGQRKLEEVRSLNDYEIAIASLLTIMGANPTSTTSLSEKDLKLDNIETEIIETKNKIAGTENAISIAMENRQDILALLENLEISRSTRRAASAGYMPSVQATGGWFFAGPELGRFDLLSRTQIGMSLNIPVFEQFQTNLAQERAEIQVEQSDTELRWLKQGVRQAIQTAILNLNAAEKQYEISELALQSAELNFESATERQKAGAATVLDYFNANNQLVQAKLTRIQGLYGYLTARKELFYQMGLILEN
ncbi:MAG: TolC family protein [Candidatus Kapaibacteriales bacterium]